MRQVEVLVPDRCLDDVRAALEEEGIDYVRTSDQDGEGSLVRFPLPTQAVEHVLGELREAGIDDEFVVVTSAETARTPHLADLEERFVEEGEEDDNVAPEEIRTKARNLTPGPLTYYVMTLLSAVVAAAGLLMNSPAIVVGSMVIAPLVGSALTASVGLVLDDRGMIRSGLSSQVFGLALAIVGAGVFGAVIRNAGFVPPTLNVATINQISQRISPGLLSLVVGVAAGAAGAFGLATALPVSLVGVMIAAAVVPAAAAVGIGLAWNLPAVTAGAFVLLVVNTVSINLAGVAVLRYLGYRPEGAETDESGSRVASILPRRSAVVVAAIVLVGAVAGVALANQMAFENGANRAVEEVLAEPAYSDFELLEVQVEFDDVGLLGRTETLTIVVRRNADEPTPGLARAIGERVADRTDNRVEVEVKFAEHQRYTPDAGSRSQG